MKTGPTGNNASATANLFGVFATQLTELGYDLRKPGAMPGDPRGSHCGAGAPRFNITLRTGDSFFVGCNSPAPTVASSSDGWMRLRWGGAMPLMAFAPGASMPTDISGQAIRSISIVLDEAQDMAGAPDHFGLAVLDNIDVNGVLVGAGVGR